MYPVVLIKLVSAVLSVEEDYSNKFCLAVVINPVSCSGGNGNNISLVQVPYFLVAIL